MSDEERVIEAIALIELKIPTLTAGEISNVAATINHGHLTGVGDDFILLLKGKDV